MKECPSVGGFPPAFGGACVPETAEKEGRFLVFLVFPCHQLWGSLLPWHVPHSSQFPFYPESLVRLPCVLLFPCVQTLRLVESQVFVSEAEWIHCILC